MARKAPTGATRHKGQGKRPVSLPAALSLHDEQLSAPIVKIAQRRIKAARVPGRK